MAEFINTIEVLGDEVVVDSIIDRSITEFKDNVITIFHPATFKGCVNLEILDLPEVTTMTQAGDAFNGLTRLKTVNMPKLTCLANNMFNACSSLESISLPEANMGGIGNNWGMGAFAGCTALVSAYLPKVTEISNYCFHMDSELVSVYAPLAKSIADYAFRKTKASKYDFPSLESIGGTNTFKDCLNLTALILRNTEKVVTLGDASCFNGEVYRISPIQGGTGYIYVPRALVDSYKEATNWSTYADQFRALEDYTVDGTITGELDETKI